MTECIDRKILEEKVERKLGLLITAKEGLLPLSHRDPARWKAEKKTGLLEWLVTALKKSRKQGYPRVSSKSNDWNNDWFRGRHHSSRRKRHDQGAKEEKFFQPVILPVELLGPGEARRNRFLWCGRDGMGPRDEEWGINDKDDNNNHRPPCARAFTEELHACRVIWALRNPVGGFCVPV